MTDSQPSLSVKSLESCPEFVSFMSIWKETRSPPEEFIDFLLDMEFYRAAGAVKWVRKTKKRLYGYNWYQEVFPYFYYGGVRAEWGAGDELSNQLPWLNGPRVFPDLDSALYFLLDTYPEPLI